MLSIAASHGACCGASALASLSGSSSSRSARQFRSRRGGAVNVTTSRRVGVVVRSGTGEEDGGEEQIAKSEKKPQQKTSLFTSITDALDFAQTRSEKDAELLADARDATQSGEKMSREQYAALRRKIGGTYKDFFKDSVEVIGDYVDDGWVDKTCRVCKTDTSNDPRTKDSMGRYAHLECAEREKSGNFFTRLFGK